MRHDAHYVEELSQHQPVAVGRMISLDTIDPNPEQPRTDFGDLSELTASIADKGVLEPLLVKPSKQTGRWMIIAGERRFRAARAAGLKEVPCVEMEVDEQTVAEIALIENMQRKDLTVWEEADGLLALCDNFGYTHEEVARKLGKSRSTVTEALSIAAIPEDVRQMCREADVSAKSMLLQIVRQPDEEGMRRLAKQLEGSGRHYPEQSGHHEVGELHEAGCAGKLSCCDCHRGQRIDADEHDEHDSPDQLSYTLRHLAS